MASSESMDASFRARVHKVFGSLSSSSQSTLPWSLTDDEVEKKEWNIRSKDKSYRDDEIPCSSSFDGMFFEDHKILQKNSRSIGKELEDDLEDLSDDEYFGFSCSGQSYKHSRGGDDKDEWEVRSAIGLDCTLDNEEEEDEYDKVAEGRENAGDRLYMRDIKDKASSLSTHNVHSSLVHHRDPRANHLAARIRLKEDGAGAEKLMANDEEPCSRASKDGHRLKSILKRKDNAAVKSSKRVKFDLSCNNNFEEALEENQDISTGAYMTEIKASNDESAFAKKKTTVPDYLMNPSKYTCYSFDTSRRIDQESSSQACMEFLGQIDKSQPTFLECESLDLPTSVTFIPRRKANSTKAVKGSIDINQNHEEIFKAQTCFAVGIAAVEAQQSEEVMMEEVEPEMHIADKSGRFQKSGRCYRTKSSFEDPVS